MNLKEFINLKAAKGYCFFTSKEAVAILKVSSLAVRRAISRAYKNGELAEPLKGFHVIVPPEYRSLGCLPADQFIPDLMEYIDSPYYVCLLSAAQYHGAAHQRPQVFQVMTNHGRRAILCGKVKIEFITNKNIQQLPFQKINTKQGYLNVSTPELTALDLVIYPDRAAGLDNVLNVLNELSDRMDPQKLIALASYRNEVTWLQRLGYLFELSKKVEFVEEISHFLKDKRVRKRPLSPTNEVKINTPYSERWKLWINEEIEVDV